MVACKSTRYVPENQYLLRNYKIKVDNKQIDRNELENFIRQRPNKKIFGIRFFLGLYNLSNLEKERWPHTWLRNIGEEPVVFDIYSAERTTRQFEIFLRNKGFYNAEVSDSVILKGRKAKVVYQITTNQPHRIRKINYNIEDSLLAAFILPDTANSLLKSNKIFDVDLLQQERARIEERLKNLGFYNFTREYVYFTADTIIGNLNVDLTIGVKKFVKRTEGVEYQPANHRQYKINRVYIYTDFDPRMALTNPVQYLERFDTISYQGLQLLYYNKLPVNPRVIVQSTFINPGELFSQAIVDMTYKNFFDLRMYRLINIQFREAQNQSDSVGINLLDCIIQLTPFTRQSYTMEVESTNSSGDFGLGGNISYQNRNIFGSAEIFDLKLKGGFETLREDDRSIFRNTYEYGVEGNLRIPKFLLPFRSVDFIKRYNPHTSLTIAYNFQRRPDYTRTIANLSFGYHWQVAPHVTHTIKPIEFNAVHIPFATPAFLDLIRGTLLEHSYQNHMIAETNYSFVFNNQDIRREQDFVFFRWNFEFAGNTLAAFNNITNGRRENDSYLLFGTEFAQFFRSDVDLRYYQYFNNGNSLVYRFFAGAGVPYGNSQAMPLIKRYFSGGANSIRAWHVRSLGPGSFYDETDLTILNRTGDLKLEANLEYRFNLFWVLEGALFLDAGNIWAIDKRDERAGAVFDFGKFYQDIAIGTGFGTRFDFTFFIFRVDVGLKLRDPKLMPGNRWIPWNRNLDLGRDMVVNIGIGYPF